MQRFISKADGDRCPMYPTCSHYASQAFAREGMLMGWVLTCDRLLRCGRDEKRLAEPIRVQGRKHVYDPVEANTFWWKAR
jgi:putative component of membrane protein insertase Oxa1/YidC/SpoIIIJ protein YidD